MGYSGRKNRLKNFWNNAGEIMNSFMRGKTTKPVRRSGRIIRKGTEGRRIVVKNASHLERTLMKNSMLAEKIFISEKKPKHFSIIYPKGRVFLESNWGVQEYFNKPNIEQIRKYFESRETVSKIHDAFSKEEYLLVKQFMKNSVNKKITLEKIKEAYEELRSWTKHSRDDFLLSPHNVLIQGINRDGKLRLTIIDV
jgi:hypothetical protein